MTLSINQYINNPLGKGSAAGSLRIVKNEYDARYEALLDIHEKFQTHIYNNRNAYYFHLLIPSETTPDLYYDIVIKIDRSFQSKDANFLNWPMKAISNSPSFVFTFANTFKRNKMLIDELRGMLPSQAVKELAEVRNPHRLLGLEKSIYYACRYIKDNFVSIDDVDRFSSKLNLRELLKELKEFSEIMKDKEIDQKKKSAEKKKQREQQKKEQREKIRGKEHTIDAVKKNDAKSKTASISGRAKKASTAKRAKRI